MMHMFSMLGGGEMMMVVFWGALAVFAVWLGHNLLSQNKPQQRSQHLTAEENIKLRYSRGEISRDEYLMMIEDLEDSIFDLIEDEYYEKPKRRLSEQDQM